MSLPSVIGAIISAIGLIPKKKKNNLWFWNGQKWVLKAAAMSNRQCKKQRAVFVKTGEDPNMFIVLRVGVEPPTHGPQIVL